jgi:hypothetical protein
MIPSKVRHEVVAFALPTHADFAARLAPWAGEVGSPTADAREHLRGRAQRRAGERGA